MNNLPVTFDASVPAHLRLPQFMVATQRMSAGLSTAAPPRISIRAARFRFIAGDGTETLVQENGGTTLDVVVLDASEHVSKFYYGRPYDQNAEDQSPACFSDNGVGPSSRSAKPQSATCAACPHNVWGSKVTPTGSKVKACTDSKKLAVIPVSNLTGDAYMLSVPAASLKTWSSVVTQTSNRGVPIPALVIRLGFDPAASHPKLTFAPQRFLDAAEAEAIKDLFGSLELDELVGRSDTVHPSAAQQVVAPLPPAAPPAPAPIEPFIGSGGSGGMFVAPQPVAQAAITPPPGMPMPQHTQQAVAQEPRRRGRPARAEVVPSSPTAAVPVAPVAAPQTVAAVPAAPASMESLLDAVLGKPHG